MNPTSILDTRKKEWKDRRRWWINKYNIQSELGREDTISKTSLWNSNDVSIFDAVLCEYMYSWFTPLNGKILDPFAGGSVRGIVSEELGFKYTGIDLSETQVNANRLQSSKPNWIHGDSNKVLDSIENLEYDFIFTCPPYHDLEIYSQDPRDLSNMPYDDFISAYRSIIKKSFDKLKNNRFACIVVSEIRDLGTIRNYKIGEYKGFVADTIDAFTRAGFHYYNDVILINSEMNASMVSKTYFDRNRKIPSSHQNVLIFVKGNPDVATIDIVGGDFMCEIYGKKYRSFREAAISINPEELIASEVERRCLSRKYKYKDWQVIGSETMPLIKLRIDDSFFESIGQASNILGIIESDLQKIITSKQAKYRHIRFVSPEDYKMSYTEMELTWTKPINLTVPEYELEGRYFYSIEEASEFYKLTPQRIYQKIRSNKYPEFIKLFDI